MHIMDTAKRVAHMPTATIIEAGIRFKIGLKLPTRVHDEALLKCPIRKTTRKALSGVRTSSPATNGIAAFALTASSIRRQYANSSRMRTTKTCRRACTNTSGAQFGSERKSHDLAAKTYRRARDRRFECPKFD